MSKKEDINNQKSFVVTYKCQEGEITPQQKSTCECFITLVKEINALGKKQSLLTTFLNKEELLFSLCRKEKLGFLIGQNNLLWDKKTGRELVSVDAPEITDEELRVEIEIWKNN